VIAAERCALRVQHRATRHVGGSRNTTTSREIRQHTQSPVPAPAEDARGIAFSKSGVRTFADFDRRPFWFAKNAQCRLTMLRHHDDEVAQEVRQREATADALLAAGAALQAAPAAAPPAPQFLPPQQNIISPQGSVSIRPCHGWIQNGLPIASRHYRA
jgi:hypothetical protein